MRPIVAATILAIVLVAPCTAQREETARIGRFVDLEMRLQHIPGMSLAVIRDGRIVVAKGYGLADVEHRVPVKPETVFQTVLDMAKWDAALSTGKLLSLAQPAVRRIDDREPGVTAPVKRALAQLADGRADRELFTAEARGTFFPDGAERIGELVERREEGGLRVYRYALTDLEATLYRTVAVTKGDKIARLAVSAE
jgi:hypothetical protein